MRSALGLVQTSGFVDSVTASDRALKAADIEILFVASAGGGSTTIGFGGETAAVDTALEAARGEGSDGLTTTILANPSEELRQLLGGALNGEVADGERAAPANGALGMLEGVGLESLTRAVDAVAKAADVNLAHFQLVGNGRTAICLWGEVAAVRTAIEAGQGPSGDARTAVLARPHPGAIRVMELYS